MSDVKQFEDMTNKELAELVEDFGLTVDAKNPAKPNKTEYVTALNAFKRKQAEINGLELEDEVETLSETPDPEEVTEEPHVIVDGKVEYVNASSGLDLMRADLLRKERIIVTDLRESQTREPTIYVNWGNRTLGNKTDVVALDGKPQYVRRGAIQNLEGCSLTIHEADDTGRDKMIETNRYVITRVKGMTQKELTALGVKQRMRDARN